MRDKSIDILRAIALVGIMIIHITPPSLIISELRNFDVPLMVFLSGVSFMISLGNKVSCKDYLLKRFQRLIIPTWIFLVVYYFAFLCLLTVLRHPFRSDIIIPDIVSNFTLMTGWYPWIMRLFFLIALFAPMTISFTKRLRNKSFLCLIIVSLLLNEIIVSVVGSEGWQTNWRFFSYLYMCFPYLIIFCVGTKVSDLSNRTIISWASISIVIYLMIAITLYELQGNYDILALYKYPPRLYYISYGLALCLFLWVLRHRIATALEKVRIDAFFSFLGKHTLWIYLWHIVFVILANQFLQNATIRFLIVFCGATSLTFIQCLVLKKITSHIKNDKTKKTLYLWFNG